MTQPPTTAAGGRRMTTSPDTLSTRQLETTVRLLERIIEMTREAPTLQLAQDAVRPLRQELEQRAYWQNNFSIQKI